MSIRKFPGVMITKAAFECAMARGNRVTVVFWEIKRDDNGKVIKAPDADGIMVEQWEETIRTLEFFDHKETAAGDVVFVGMAHWGTREGWGPTIRSVRLDRVIEWTEHKRCPYIIPNTYFAKEVRAHAVGAGWHAVADMDDAEIWEVIRGARDPEESIARMAQHIAA